jgi:hypothetical protein
MMTTKASECRPRWSSPRRADRPTWGPVAAKMAEALGTPFMPWQQQVADTVLEVDPTTGLFVYDEVIITVPRQSGKTTLVLAVALARMQHGRVIGMDRCRRQRIVYTAQTRNKAREKFVDEYIEMLKAAPRLKGKWRERTTNGSEQIRWHNGGQFGIDATSETSGHGPVLDMGINDEAFADIDDRTEQAMVPAMATRISPQYWVISTAGTDKSVYLRDKIRVARAGAEAGEDSGMAYFNWSADPADDIADPRTWWTFMPALGHTVTEKFVRNRLKAMKRPEFKRAFGNLWVPSSALELAIDGEKWQECADSSAAVIPEAARVLSVDVAPGSAWAAIAVAGPGEYLDGEGVAVALPTGEVIDYRAGDDWVVARVVELRARYGDLTVVLDPSSGPTNALLPAFREVGIEPKCVTSRELTQACSLFESNTLKTAWRHRGQQLVEDALNGAARRSIGDAWAWTRTNSAFDITPLVSLTLAMWGLSLEPAPYDLMSSFG